jgi:hypothetical protein
MSLINQMLKDLEQRGAGDSDVVIADKEKTMISKLDNIQPMPSQLPSGLPLMKISVVIALLASAAYYWTQHGVALTSNHNETDKAVVANLKLQPQNNIPTPKQLIVPAAADTTITTQKNITPMINESTKNDSVPLFVTELKYQPIAVINH